MMIDFTLSHPLGALATVSSLYEPSVAWVYIFVKPDFKFYFGTRSSTQKFKDIAQNPSVAIALSDGVTLETLQVRGIATSVLDADKVRDLLEQLRATFASERKQWAAPVDKATGGLHQVDVSRWIPPVAQMHEGNYVFFEVIPEWARFRRYDADWKKGHEFTEYQYPPSDKAGA